MGLIVNLCKATILQAQDLPTHPVEVPEWGGTVYVRTMTGTERDAFESLLIADNGKRDLSNMRARLLVRTLVDENGARLFGDEDVAALGGKSVNVLDRLLTVSRGLNGFGAAEGEKIEKNSAAAQSGASTSGSA